MDNNGHASIRIGPWINGKRWPDLMNLIFFYITWTNLRSTWHQDALWEEGKPAEAEFCWKILGLLIHVDITLTCTTYMG